MTDTCRAAVRLDLYSLDCNLPVGHNGMHRDQGDWTRVNWIEKNTGVNTVIERLKGDAK